MDIGTAVWYRNSKWVVFTDDLDQEYLTLLNIQGDTCVAPCTEVTLMFTRIFSKGERVELVESCEMECPQGSVVVVEEVDYHDDLRYGIMFEGNFYWVYEFQLKPLNTTKLASRWQQG